MIDSEYFNVVDDLKNALLLEPYTEQDVIKNTDQSNVLTNAKDYILKLLEEADDVQEYLKNHPYPHTDVEAMKQRENEER